MLKNVHTNKNLMHDPYLQARLGLGIRFMTSSKRVQDRSHKKRVQDLEIVTEKLKILSKFLLLFEVLKQEPENVIQVRNLEQYRRQINLPKPHRMSEFLAKSPKLFELYKDQRGTLWCGLTRAAENLIEEEEEIIAKNSDKAAEHVTRMLMMAVDKRLALDKIVHYRRDFGLPLDFRIGWVHNYPELFKVVKPFTPYDEGEYLELALWRPEWAITELEKKQMGINDEYSCKDHAPGLLSLSFPMKFPRDYKKVYRYGGKIEHFQKMEYLSPYADGKELKAGSREFDKRAVAIMHELLSFTIEKRLVTDHLTHFRREFVMPQKLMRLLLKHIGIFYVSERGKRFSVFLNEAYEGTELIEKHPLVMWKEKVQNLVGYRGKKRRFGTSEDLQDEDDRDLFGSESDDDNGTVETEGEEDCMSELEGTASLEDDSEMEIDEIHMAYKD
ncbi:hypothetical protein LIER_17799 [Lithospermum erythrorhizon]|uniref:PORR domain-containing protein n=1 Tax=Lithospermum erythrorhizon TaxID=34254 RepID=A0AAV3QBU3_LITER